jgi:cytochrome c5
MDTPRNYFFLVLALAGATFFSSPANAQSPGPRSGEQVYKEICAVCHATGVANAPKFGDRKVWAPLIAEGQAVLTAHAWVGVRAMPPRGGNPNLSLDEFSRAAAFMARAAGGSWKDPDAAMLASIRVEEKKRMAETTKKK